MKNCVECEVLLDSPRKVPLCKECFQEMMDYKLDKLEAKEVVTA